MVKASCATPCWSSLQGRDCGAVLNPLCYVDFHSKSWTCPFCHTRNRFPQHYADHITETNLPAELLQMCSTIEYIIPQVVCQPPVFLLVLDIALIEEELEQAKDSLQQSLAMMPQNALVGFITFGAMCYVHELASTTLPKAYAFRGGKEYTAQQVAYQLGFALKNDPRGTMGAQAARRFLLPVAECEFTLNSLLDDLSRDAWPPGGHDRRPFRCTGAALSVALGLVEATCPQSSVGEARREVLCRAFRAASAWRPRYSRQTCPRQLTDPIERQERDSGTVRTSLVGTQSLKTITVLLSSVDFNGFQHQTVVM
ncbi:unnamed protein product [Durusdinium trenchii]|uniref:Protein transport protein SEC23 n=1 Tax=Durusdinium trenchii TaxID=1381693 RepID=A0ABP0JZR3_9DINO